MNSTIENETLSSSKHSMMGALEINLSARQQRTNQNRTEAIWRAANRPAGQTKQGSRVRSFWTGILAGLQANWPMTGRHLAGASRK